MRRSWYLRLVSLLLTFALVGAATWYVAARSIKNQRIEQLTSVDDDLRARALGYIAARPRAAREAAPRLQDAEPDVAIEIYYALTAADVLDDPAVAACVTTRIEAAADDEFKQWVAVLDEQGRWSRRQVSLPIYVKWIDLLTRDNAPAARALAAKRIADLFEHADSPLLNPLLQRLIKDTEADVRYAALLTAAELAGATESENRIELEAVVALATEDDEDEIARDAWLLSGLLQPLSGFSPPQWKEMPPRVAQAIPFMALHTNAHRPAVAIEIMQAADVDPAVRRIAIYMLVLQDSDLVSAEDRQALYVKREPVPALDQPTPQRLKPILTGADIDSRARDVACMVAAAQLTPAQNEALIRDLLGSYYDQSLMTGAILAGLTDLRPAHTPKTGQSIDDLLLYRIEKEDQTEVQYVMRLGLWMQDRSPMMDQIAPMLLAQDDIPRSTLLLAMLHKHRPEALDHLLTPRRAEFYPLRQWLSDYQWWRVLQPCLPEAAPPFWLDAHPELQQFQIDVLRNWYLVNRHHIWRDEQNKLQSRL